MKNVIPNAEAFIRMLTDGDAFIGIDKRSRNPYIYMGVGEGRYYLKKVNVHIEETNKMSSKWIHGEAAAKPTTNEEAEPTSVVDPAKVEAMKQLILEGKINVPTA